MAQTENELSKLRASKTVVRAIPDQGRDFLDENYEIAVFNTAWRNDGTGHGDSRKWKGLHRGGPAGSGVQYGREEQYLIEVLSRDITVSEKVEGEEQKALVPFKVCEHKKRRKQSLEYLICIKPSQHSEFAHSKPAREVLGSSSAESFLSMQLKLPLLEKQCRHETSTEFTSRLKTWC